LKESTNHNITISEEWSRFQYIDMAQEAITTHLKEPQAVLIAFHCCCFPGKMATIGAFHIFETQILSFLK
jgi:hypothetical protein